MLPKDFNNSITDKDSEKVPRKKEKQKRKGNREYRNKLP
jgi:hypothetical protein